MMRTVTMVGCVVCAVVFVSGELQAQNPIELGQDASVGILFNGGTVFEITVPVSQVRIGFRSSEKIGLEPRFALFFASGDGSSFTAIVAGLHVLYDLQPRSSSNSSLYVTGGANLFFTDAAGSSSDFSLGGGVGVRIPLIDRLMWRLEGRLDHQFDFSLTSLSGLFGLSFFTR